MTFENVAFDQAPAAILPFTDREFQETSNAAQAFRGQTVEIKTAGSPSEAGQSNSAITGGLAAWQVKRIAAHIETNLSQKLQIEALAPIVRLSPSYFSSAFKRSFGMPPHVYITVRRIELAKLLLVEGAMRACEIALECGMADQAHLSRVFRRITGTTPTAWRRRQMRQAVIRRAA